jgi:hypothetical protein
MTLEKNADTTPTPEVNGPMAPVWLSLELARKPDSPTCARQAMDCIRPLMTW